jgi:hypothetical protein
MDGSRNGGRVQKWRTGPEMEDGQKWKTGPEMEDGQKWRTGPEMEDGSKNGGRAQKWRTHLEEPTHARDAVHMIVEFSSSVPAHHLQLTA